MQCVNCNMEMEGGYMLQLGFGGNIRIVQASPLKSEACPDVSVCPRCGKVDLYVDYKSIKNKQDKF